MFPNRKHYVVLVLCVILEVSSSPHLINQDLNEAWNSYKGTYGKHYESYEDGARRYMWERNTKKIMKHNLLADIGVHSYWMEVNKFADWTAEELQILRTCLAPTNFVDTAEEVFRHKLDFQLPDSVDWRTKGYVTEIKDQGECGSCWAFSATGSLEGQHKAKTGTLVSLSEQNLVDCSWKEGNEGCDGGYMSNAFRYVQNNKGIDTEESYPYTGLDGDCKFKRSTVGATCEGYAKVLRGNETSLQAATATIGPISVAIDAADDFMFYSRGIFYDPTCSSEELNHGVLVVGYGSKGTKDYWIVKNSWGISWGMDGYVLMSRNRRNNCGIASMATYPLM